MKVLVGVSLGLNVRLMLISPRVNTGKKFSSLAVLKAAGKNSDPSSMRSHYQLPLGHPFENKKKRYSRITHSFV